MPRQIIDAFKRFQETEKFKGLRERGLHVIPDIRNGTGKLMVFVGTAAAIGGAYIAYREWKKKHLGEKVVE